MSLATATTARRLTLRTTPAARKPRRVEPIARPATVAKFVGLALDVIDSWHETEYERRASYPARLDAYDRLRDLCGPGVDPRWYRMMTFAYRCRQGTTIRPWCRSGESLVMASIEHARGFGDWAGSRDAAGRFYGYLTRPQRARVNRYIASKIGLGKYDRPWDPARDRFEALIANCVHGVRLENRAMYA